MNRQTAIAGIALIALTGLIHLVEAPEYLEEQTYIGVLFILGILGAIAAAIGIARGQRSGWLLGLLVAGGAFVGFVLSRTTGLPGFKEEEWEGLGIVSMVIEAAFLGVAARVL